MRAAFVARGRCWGAVHVARREGAREFSRDDVDALAMITATVAAMRVGDARELGRARAVEVRRPFQWRTTSPALEGAVTVAGTDGQSTTQRHVGVTMLSANGSVLVVDDDPAFRRLARCVLVAFGLDVAGEAGTAASAMRAADALRPDAVLVDVGLPDVDGVTLARELTGLPWSPRVVLTSTDTEATAPSEVRASGAEAFVPKHELLDAALDDLLGRRAA